ncbi:hypothetical protein SAMD00019534_118230 [Acytostelium subglobosum LB1]|uniref:hypothetical protein n=1 Tax=Acytostelium subglobosum LB1 TaxID=1410327 RepID=UPI000644DCC1|nr:hypothetical protein SAMD00019534_118230 [Acytostelium subglobosum LB1]GAM28647.1 hypothetical protein SAMD00019534_118230 [Acytostelium subglobosum LB1]|eukprot:XP_012748425.1 hypothetical protein SAMD00019534_118230 [Acytostelium subglobosum LB1]
MNGTAPTDKDDVVIYASKRDPSKTITLTSSITINSLNISGAILQTAPEATFTLASMYIARNAIVYFRSPVTIANIRCDGTMQVAGGALTISGRFRSYGNISMTAGSFTVNTLEISDVNIESPTLYGGELHINGNSRIAAMLIMQGSAKMFIDSAVVVVTGGFECRANATVNLKHGNLQLVGSDIYNFDQAVTIDAGSLFNASCDQCKLSKGLIALDDASAVVIQRNSELLFSGTCELTIPVTLRPFSSISVASGTLTLHDLTTALTTEIKLRDQGEMVLVGDRVIHSDVTLEDTSTLHLYGNVDIGGLLTDRLGSLIRVSHGVLRIINIVNTQINTNFQLDSKSSLYFNISFTYSGDIQTLPDPEAERAADASTIPPPSAPLTVATNQTLTIYGNGNTIQATIILEAYSDLNFETNCNTVLDRFTQLDNTSTITLQTTSNVTLTHGCNLLTPITLIGDCSIVFSGESTVNGIVFEPNEDNLMPYVGIVNCSCSFEGKSAYKFGEISIIYSKLALSSAMDIAILSSDGGSSLDIHKGGLLTVNGDGSNFAATINILPGGSANISGNTDLSGITVGVNANFSITREANIVINGGGPCSFDSVLTASDKSSINFKTGCSLFKGANFNNPTTTFGVTGNTAGKNVYLYGNSTFNSQVSVAAVSFLTLMPGATAHFLEGITLSSDSHLNLIGATAIFGPKSRLSGKLVTSNQSTIIVDSMDSVTTFANEIHSIDNATNNMLIKTGTAHISINSVVAGTLNITEKGTLEIYGPLQCFGGVTNAGTIQLASGLNVTGAGFKQVSGQITVQPRTQIIADWVDIAGGRIVGNGSISTRTGCTIGSQIDGNFDIQGSFTMLQTAVLTVRVNTTTEHSRIKVSRIAYLNNGQVEVNLDMLSADLKLGDTIPFIQATQTIGTVTLADDSATYFNIEQASSTITNLVVSQPMQAKIIITPPKTNHTDSSTGSRLCHVPLQGPSSWIKYLGYTIVFAIIIPLLSGQ